MTTFGQQLRRLRRQQRLTQMELAKTVGVSNTYISALESGRKPAPPHEVVIALASSLQVDADVLWGPAFKEREERLMGRLQGKPTSSARRKTERETSRQRHSRTPEQNLVDAVQSLRDAAQSPTQRRALLDKLESLAKRLLSSPDDVR